MNSGTSLQSRMLELGTANSINKRSLLLRLLRAAQPISRTEMAERLNIDKSTVTEIVKPLLDSGILREEKLPAVKGQGRRSRILSFVDDENYFIGVNVGVRRSQVGLTTLKGEIIEQEDFETPSSPSIAFRKLKRSIEEIRQNNANRRLETIGVSVPGMTDPERRGLIFAPNLDWRDLDIATILDAGDTRIVVENDSTAAAMYEARLKIKDTTDGLLSNFILVRSGTGIGVGLVIGGEVYRGSGVGRGIAGEFGHMTIVAGGKKCVCGNRGCWEKYGSAAAAASLYLGDRSLRRNETLPRFIEIVAKAENGDNRSRRTLEMIGDYLGIGIANVIMGMGIPRVIVSGRLVYGWKYIETPLKEAINRSIIGKTGGWSVEPGEPAGAALGGSLEVAVEDFLARI